MNKRELLKEAGKLYKMTLGGHTFSGNEYSNGKSDGINLIIQLIKKLDDLEGHEAIVNFDEENFRQWVAINLWGARVVKSSMRTTWVEEKELEDFLVNAVKESLDKKVLKESKKIEIPKNVAEWIEELKSYSDVDIFEEVEDIRGVLSSQNMHKEHAIWGWIEGHKDDFMRAWLEHPNIEVEKEKLYYVIIPTKAPDGEYYYLDGFGGIDSAYDLKEVAYHTESFIRFISESLWQFAQPVEEGE